MNSRPRLTVTQAVAAFNVTKRTLQRRLAAGELDGATKDDAGQWSIPIEALHALGIGARQATTNDAPPLRHSAPKNIQNVEKPGELSAPNSAPPTPDDATEITSLRAILHDTQQQLATEQRLREAAERNTEDLRTAMRMVEAGLQSPASIAPNQRRRWWQR